MVDNIDDSFRLTSHIIIFFLKNLSLIDTQTNNTHIHTRIQISYDHSNTDWNVFRTVILTI